VLQALGVSNTGRFLTKFPDLVHADLERDLLPSVELLRAIGAKRIGQFIASVPFHAFKVDVLRERVEYLQGVGVRHMGRVADQAPTVLGLSVEASLKPRVAWLASHFPSPAKLIALHPTLLTFKLDSVTPKLEYVLNQMGRTHEEVSRFPQLLGYSLDFLRLRHEFLKRHRPEAAPSLHRMCRASQHQFAVGMAKSTLATWDDFVAAEAPAVGEPVRAADRFMQRHAAAVRRDEDRREKVNDVRDRILDALEQQTHLLPGLSAIPSSDPLVLPPGENASATSSVAGESAESADSSTPP